MVNARRIVAFIVLSFLLFLFQTTAGIAQESSSSSDEGSASSAQESSQEVANSDSTDAEATPPQQK